MQECDKVNVPSNSVGTLWACFTKVSMIITRRETYWCDQAVYFATRLNLRCEEIRQSSEERNDTEWEQERLKYK